MIQKYWKTAQAIALYQNCDIFQKCTIRAKPPSVGNGVIGYWSTGDQ